MTQPRLGVEPTALPPTDLAIVFGRSSALRGRLQPIRDTTRPPSSANAPAPNMPKIAKSGATKRSGPKADSPPEGETATRGVIAYLPLSLRDRLRQRRRADATPFADIVLDAVEATHDRLGDLINGRRPAAARSELFVRHARTPADAEPHVQVYLRLNAENLQVLDQLTEQYKASSRSALITAALGSYLDQASN